MAQSPLNDTTQPVDSEEEGRSPTTDRQWLIEKKERLSVEHHHEKVSLNAPSNNKACFYFELRLCDELILPTGVRYDQDLNLGSHICVPTALPLS